jgi:phosphohistidine phosphatase
MLIRHGIAEDVSPDGRDEYRRLTQEGVNKTRKVAKALAKQIHAPGRLLYSPKIRAAQTASLLSDALGLEGEALPELANGPAEAVLRWCTEQELPERVMLVGHEPTLSEFAELICFGQTYGRLRLKKAGLILLKTLEDSAVHDPRKAGIPVGPASLETLLSPKHLINEEAG